jgi:hypothetical protein
MPRPVRRLIVFALALAGMAFIPAAGRADIVFFPSPGPVQPDENVQYNDIPNPPDLTVLGTTNQTTTPLLFNQPVAPETLFTPSRGQARIESTDGFFTSLRAQFEAPLLGFTEFEANPNIATSGLMYTVRVTETNNQVNDFSFESKGGGQNFFGLRAIDGQVIRSVAILGPTNQLQDVRQIRVGGVTAVSEASSLALMGVVATAATAVGLLRRARNVVA